MVPLQQLNLHRRFQQPTVYDPSAAYKPLPFTFMPLDDARYVAVNLVGEHIVCDRTAIEELIGGTLDRRSSQYLEFRARHFLQEDERDSAVDLLALKYRAKHATMSRFTALHIFVVTLRCDHSCPYCQVSRVSEDKEAFDMSEATALKALDLTFQTPAESIKIEFQGGESLLNFPIIRLVVLEAKARALATGKSVDFVIATNLAHVTVEMLVFCRDHHVGISTSLDGPAALHNANRPRPGNDSHQRALAGIDLARRIVGRDQVSALMTTTSRSLPQVESIIDEYVRHDFPGIFLRWLSPFGFAKKSARVLGYPSESFNEFYERGLRYILDLNKKGVSFHEYYAELACARLLRPFDTGYVDLMSPAGAGIAAVVYNYDGDVYASDEARMLAETGDKTFRLGNVHRDSYGAIFHSETLINTLLSTMVECTPMCAECAFHSFCGTDPVYHHATQGDQVGHRPTSSFCARNMFVFKLLIRILEDEPENAAILRKWIVR